MLSREWCLSYRWSSLQMSGQLLNRFSIAFHCVLSHPIQDQLFLLVGRESWKYQQNVLSPLVSHSTMVHIYFFSNLPRHSSHALRSLLLWWGDCILCIVHMHTCIHAYTHQRRTPPLDPLADQCIALAFHALWFYWMYSVIFFMCYVCLYQIIMFTLFRFFFLLNLKM